MSNNELYSDKNPETTIKGLGFKNEQKAKDTLKKIKKKFKISKASCNYNVL